MMGFPEIILNIATVNLSDAHLAPRRAERLNSQKPAEDGIHLCSRKTVACTDRVASSIKVLLFVMRCAGIPEYRTVKSNHIYSYWQKIVLLVLRQEEGMSWERFLARLPSYKATADVLGMKYIPDHTTMEKFAKNVGRGHLDLIISGFSAAVGNEHLVLAIDGTGFSDRYASAHFEKRIAELRGSVYGRRRARCFVKTSLAGDTETKIVLSADVVRGKTHDIVMGRANVERLAAAGIPAEYVLADKGFDAEWFHELCRERLGATALIPVRMKKDEREKKCTRTKGIRRCSMKWKLKMPENAARYRKRSSIECINSVIKRLFGDSVKARTEETIGNELLSRVIAHNIERIVKLELEGVFA